jgi:hypothetical protein
MPTIPHHIEVYRAFPGGEGLNGVTCQARLRSDTSLIREVTSATVDTEDGVAALSLADTATSGQSSYLLFPGPYRVTGTTSGVTVTLTQSSTVTGSTGPLNIMALAFLARAIGNGLISNPSHGLNTGAVTAAGAARVVTVDTFATTMSR